jgi:hypothetical protein
MCFEQNLPASWRAKTKSISEMDLRALKNNYKVSPINNKSATLTAQRALGQKREISYGTHERKNELRAPAEQHQFVSMATPRIVT